METRLYVSTPCFGNKIFSDYMVDVMNLDHACQQWGIGFDICLIGNFPMLPIARSTCVKHFLDSESTHMLFVDADISFTPMNVLRLLQANKDFCCSSYPKKAIRWERLVNKTFSSTHDLERAALDYTHHTEPDAKTDDGFIESSAAATGFMLLKRTVLEKMIEAYPELQFNSNYESNGKQADSKNLYALFNPVINPVSRECHGDDNSFCGRWTQIGGKIYVDIENPVTHIGLNSYGICASSNI